jgi:hypothetical protein
MEGPMRRREYENLLAVRQRWQQDIRGAPRRIGITLGVVAAIMLVFMLIFWISPP